jgi:hypothetical protein
MIVEAQVTIHGSKTAVWAASTNLEHTAEHASFPSFHSLEAP